MYNKYFMYFSTFSWDLLALVWSNERLYNMILVLDISIKLLHLCKAHSY